MADRKNSLVSLLAALVIVVTGLIPVVWLLTTPATGSAVGAEVVVDTTTTLAPTTTTTEVTVPVPDLKVDELDSSVVRVLQANGYAELTPQSDATTELPPAVARVLIDHAAVLTVVEGDPTPSGG